MISRPTIDVRLVITGLVGLTLLAWVGLILTRWNSGSASVPASVAAIMPEVDDTSSDLRAVIEEFNQLTEQQQWNEAEDLAKQAALEFGWEPVVDQMLQKAISAQMVLDGWSPPSVPDELRTWRASS